MNFCPRGYQFEPRLPGMGGTINRPKRKLRLMFPINTGHFDIVWFLVERGAIMDRSSDLLFADSPLSLAALMGHFNIVRFLVEKGALVNHEQYEHLSPLNSGCLNNHHEIIMYLLDHGAAPKSTSYGPLYWALYRWQLYGSTKIAGHGDDGKWR